MNIQKKFEDLKKDAKRNAKIIGITAVVSVGATVAFYRNKELIEVTAKSAKFLSENGGAFFYETKHGNFLLKLVEN